MPWRSRNDRDATGTTSSGKQRLGNGPGPDRVAVVDGAVEGFHIEVEGLQADAQVQARARIAAVEFRQARSQPPSAEGRQYREIKHILAACIGHDLPGCRRHLLQGTADVMEVQTAGIGEHDPLPDPAEQFDAQPILQMAHLFRNCPLRQMQFLGGPCKTQMAGCTFEGNQGIGRRQKGAFHVRSFREKSSSCQFGMNNGGEIAFLQLLPKADYA